VGGLLPVLTIHSLDDRTSLIPFPAPLLREAMARLHERGFGTLHPLAAVHCLQRGAAYPVPERYGLCAPVVLIVGERASRESVQGGDPS